MILNFYIASRSSSLFLYVISFALDSLWPIFSDTILLFFFTFLKKKQTELKLKRSWKSGRERQIFHSVRHFNDYAYITRWGKEQTKKCNNKCEQVDYTFRPPISHWIITLTRIPIVGRRSIYSYNLFRVELSPTGGNSKTKHQQQQQHQQWQQYQRQQKKNILRMIIKQ